MYFEKGFQTTVWRALIILFRFSLTAWYLIKYCLLEFTNEIVLHTINYETIIKLLKIIPNDAIVD